jgi:hypothetical protein
MPKTPIQAQAPAGLGQSAEDLATAAAAGLPDEPSEVEATVTVVAEDQAAPPEAADPPQDPPPAEPAKQEGVFALVAQLNDQVVETRVKLQAAESELNEMKASRVGLRQIVIEQTQNMRIRLGMPAGTDLDGLTDAALVTSHQSVRDEFMARFRPGAQSQVPAEDTKLGVSNVTRLDQAIRKVTSFSK